MFKPAALIGPPHPGNHCAGASQRLPKSEPAGKPDDHNSLSHAKFITSGQKRQHRNRTPTRQKKEQNAREGRMNTKTSNAMDLKSQKNK